MSITKFTAGPWKYSFESADPNWAIVTDDHGAIVANVNSETGPDATSAPATRKMPSEANAHLIASSPDLYAALDEILDYRGGAENALADSYVVERIVAALAKARGETP